MILVPQFGQRLDSDVPLPRDGLGVRHVANPSDPRPVEDRDRVLGQVSVRAPDHVNDRAARAGDRRTDFDPVAGPGRAADLGAIT